MVTYGHQAGHLSNHRNLAKLLGWRHQGFHRSTGLPCRMAHRWCTPAFTITWGISRADSWHCCAQTWVRVIYRDTADFQHCRSTNFQFCKNNGDVNCAIRKNSCFVSWMVIEIINIYHHLRQLLIYDSEGWKTIDDSIKTLNLYDHAPKLIV